MTPRERLEAAGMCSDCESNQCAAGCRCPCHQKNANQAAQLARDEAKETSDGRDERLEGAGNDDSQRNSGILSGGNRDGSDTSAPVATSVSAPDLAQKFHEAYERLAPQFGYETRKASAKPWAEVPENNRKLMTAVCEEILKYASSSSAALLAANEVIRRQLKKVCDRAEAAEARVAALREQVERLRFKLYHYAAFDGKSHATSCSIWREDGQGHAEGFEGSMGPCNCGALINYWRERAAVAESKCAASLEVLKKACDRDWKDETLYQAAVIASNAIYWRDQEIVTLRDSRDRLQEALRRLAKIPTIMANSYVLQIIEAALGDPPERGV